MVDVETANQSERQPSDEELATCRLLWVAVHTHKHIVLVRWGNRKMAVRGTARQKWFILSSVETTRQRGAGAGKSAAARPPRLRPVRSSVVAGARPNTLERHVFSAHFPFCRMFPLFDA